MRNVRHKLSVNEKCYPQISRKFKFKKNSASQKTAKFFR